MVDRVASADAVDRAASRSPTSKGPGGRARATRSDSHAPDVEQIDLLRLAIFGFDVELARLARQALAQLDSEAAVDLIAEALKLPMEPRERER
jgi:hypothetical protein